MGPMLRLLTLPAWINTPQSIRYLVFAGMCQLEFSLDAMLEATTTVVLTKKVVISLIGRIYNPLGFLSPITICFKILMQELCKNKLGWDQLLDRELLAKWTKLVDQLKGAPPITLPICLQRLKSESRTYPLHRFCDVSTAGFNCSLSCCGISGWRRGGLCVLPLCHPWSP